jgi:hypothetical protein
LTLQDFTTGATTASTTNSWKIEGSIGTITTGATGTLESKWWQQVQLGAAGNLTPETRLDQNNAASSSIDLTAQLFLRTTVLMSTADASNSVTARMAYVDGSGADVSASTFIVQSCTAALSAEQCMSALATGLVKNTTTTGAQSIAVAGTDYVAPGGALGTPSSGTATNITGLPLVAGTTGTLTVARGGTNATSFTGSRCVESAADGLSLVSAAAACGAGGGGSGDVVGPGSATDNAITRFDSTTGKLIQNSGVLLDDTNNMSGAGSYAAGATPATAGLYRSPNNTSGPCWRNAGNSANFCIKLNASNEYEFDAPINITGTPGPQLFTGITPPSAPAGAEQWYLFANSATDLPGYIYNGGTAAYFYSSLNPQLTYYKDWGGDLVGVSGGVAGHVWDDDPLSTACTPLAVTGTNQTYGACTFPDLDGEYGRQLNFSIPGGGITVLNADIWWKTTGTGNARFRVQTLCYASDAAGDSAYSNSTYVTAAAGTSGRLNMATMSSITITGCDPNERMAVRFSRNRTEASDTLNAALDVARVVLRATVSR